MSFNSSSYIVCLILITNPLLAEELTSNNTSKEVYSFKSESGTPVFTDKKPKNHQFNTQTIKTTVANQEPTSIEKPIPNLSNNTKITHNTTTIIHQYETRSIDGSKRKVSKRRCKFFKKKLERVTDKMKAGYRPSEYKRLEKERVKYRRLVFNKCDSRVQ